MKKWLIPVIIVAVIAFAGYSWVKGFYNTTIQLNESVSESWGNVQTAYQRRNDLIGNLVNTVKGAADFERETLTQVIEARAKATSVQIDPTNITPEQLAQFNQVQGGLSGALKSLLVTVERYPDLKANQNFLKLQDELASTENQILTARTRFNKAGIAAFGTLNDMDSKLWEDIIKTNVLGMYYVTKEVLPYLIEKNEGDIINISSTAGLNGNASTSAYSASKFAVIGLSESLMKEVRKNNIRVNTLTPSTIASDMAIELGITDGNPEKVLQPEDFAELIVAGLKLPRRAMIGRAHV